MEKDDLQPIVRVEMPDGTAYYPQFERNTKGEWELPDKAYWQKMIALQDSRRQSKAEKV